MLLSNLDGGIHDADQYVRKLSGTFIYAKIPGHTEPQTIYISAIDNKNANINVYPMKAAPYAATHKLTEIDVESLRPEAGLYNLETRPVRIVHLFNRQWQIGTSDHTIFATYVTGEAVSVKNIMKSVFNSHYPTFAEACQALIKDEKRHIAITKTFSLKKAKNRLVLLYLFKPVMSFTSGFSFVEPEADSLVYCHPQIKEWTTEYDNIWRTLRTANS